MTTRARGRDGTMVRMAGDAPQPTSWRDVYALVRDTRLDILTEVGEAKTEVAGLRAKIDTHLLEHATTNGVRAGERKVFGLAKSTIALIVSILSGIAAFSAIIAK